MRSFCFLCANNQRAAKQREIQENFTCFYSTVTQKLPSHFDLLIAIRISFSIMILRSYLSFIFTSILIVSSNSTSLNGVPVGHLKPLGSHKPPETNLVDDLQEMPSPQEFWTKYVLPSKAVVLRGAAKHGKAFKLWTDEYLKEKFADLELRLEGKKEKSSKVPIGAQGVGRDTLGKLTCFGLPCFLLFRFALVNFTE